MHGHVVAKGGAVPGHNVQHTIGQAALVAKQLGNLQSHVLEYRYIEYIIYCNMCTVLMMLIVAMMALSRLGR